MPRQPRHFVPGYPVHVISRGVNRQPVFFEDSDYALYLGVLQRAAELYGCSIHAYVLMTNHVHLLMTPATVRAVPLVFQALGRSYVQAFNRRHERSGTLWEGRYRTCLVDSDEYLLTCYRYIELNPVRAGIAEAPRAYPFSSYHFNALGKPDPLITPHDSYLALGSDRDGVRRTYRAQFSNPIRSSELHAIRESANACGVLGSARFRDDVEGLVGRVVRNGKRGRPRKRDCSA